MRLLHCSTACFAFHPDERCHIPQHLEEKRNFVKIIQHIRNLSSRVAADEVGAFDDLYAEIAKSRMLREEMALADRLPPTEISTELCEIEKECLDRLRKIYAELNAREYKTPESPSAFEESDEERDQLRLKLEQTWVQEEEIRERKKLRRDPTYLWLRLGEILFPQLESHLDGVKYVYFLPSGQFFHNLPLHALTLHGRPFIERWGVAYAPSISVLESTLARPKRKGDVLVMGYSLPVAVNRTTK